MELLDRTFYQNTIQAWLTAAAITLGAIILLRTLLKLLATRLVALARRTENQWDDLVLHALSRTRWFFLAVVSLQAGSLVLTLPAGARRGLTIALAIGFLIQAGIWAGAALRFWVDQYRERNLEEDRAGTTTMSALSFVGQLAIWSAVLLLALDNLGVDVTALIAGLGVGGIAVALALQKILGDLFASLAIVLDKPFVLGDFVIVDSLLGTVEHIGLKTTRVRSLSGEQLIFSNADLLNSRLRNYGRMFERRVVFTIGVTYQTEKERLEEIPGIIREAIEAQDRTRFDRSHFFRYGDFSLDFESVYHVLSPDYNAYMDIQQAVNLRIYEEFGRRGIEFAYPTQTLFVSRADAPSGAAA